MTQIPAGPPPAAAEVSLFLSQTSENRGTAQRAGYTGRGVMSGDSPGEPGTDTTQLDSIEEGEVGEVEEVAETEGEERVDPLQQRIEEILRQSAEEEKRKITTAKRAGFFQV